MLNNLLDGNDVVVGDVSLYSRLSSTEIGTIDQPKEDVMSEDCKNEHRYLNTFESLPYDQGGAGRHKCWLRI